MNVSLRPLALLVLASIAPSARAAEVSIDDITIPVGTQSVDVPVILTPTSAGEMIGAMNIFFGAGTAADAIPILNTGTEFDGSIWDSGSFFGVPGTPVAHSAQSAVAMLNPLEIVPDGIAITYTLDTSDLPGGTYLLDPNLLSGGVGTDARDRDMVLLDLTFVTGTLRVQTMQFLTGDYNGNGAVEQADLDLVLLHWGEPGIPNGWVNDLPVGNIDQNELDGVLLHWGMMANQMAAAGVPEPSTVCLAGMLVAFASIRVLAAWRMRAARNR